jgi:hypothetical protein
MTRTDVMKDVLPRRLWRPEQRPCAYEHCGKAFTAKYRDEIFCTAKCGRAARGCDAQGRPLKRVS